MGNFDETMARKVFCSATEQHMVGSKYVWVVLGDYSPGWWRQREPGEAGCSPQQLQTALHGYITTEILPVASQDRLTVANLVSRVTSGVLVGPCCF